MDFSEFKVETITINSEHRLTGSPANFYYQLPQTLENVVAIIPKKGTMYKSDRTIGNRNYRLHYRHTDSSYHYINIPQGFYDPTDLAEQITILMNVEVGNTNIYDQDNNLDYNLCWYKCVLNTLINQIEFTNDNALNPGSWELHFDNGYISGSNTVVFSVGKTLGCTGQHTITGSSVFTSQLQPKLSSSYFEVRCDNLIYNKNHNAYGQYPTLMIIDSLAPDNSINFVQGSYPTKLMPVSSDIKNFNIEVVNDENLQVELTTNWFCILEIVSRK